jgi:hypothetical protein
MTREEIQGRNECERGYAVVPDDRKNLSQFLCFTPSLLLLLLLLLLLPPFVQGTTYIVLSTKTVPSSPVRKAFVAPYM